MFMPGFYFGKTMAAVHGCCVCIDIELYKKEKENG